MICPVCSKPFEEDKGYGWCEYRDECPHKYCSVECGDGGAIEEYTPACPGVYWCAMCRDGFLEAAKGHKFLLSHPDDSPDVKTYTGYDNNKVFVEQCVNCGMWSYEFQSSTEAKSQYQDQSCGTRIRDMYRDDVNHLQNIEWGPKPIEETKSVVESKPMKTVYIFFGEMGSGKSYRGSQFAQLKGFKFFEGDSVVPPRMMERINKFKSISEELLEEYMDVLADSIADQMADTNNLVVSQALYRNKDRESLILFLECLGYRVQMYWVQTRWHRNIQNLMTRQHGWKWVLYWLLNKPFFQKPTHECQIWRNIYTGA